MIAFSGKSNIEDRRVNLIILAGKILSRSSRKLVGVLTVMTALSFGCDRTGPGTRPAAPATRPAPAAAARVASLVPAATDLLVGMGASDHLVAVSNWDTNRPEIASLPRVGDYQSTDWEKLAELKPDVMIVFMSGTRMPAGLTERARALHIGLVNLKVETVADVFSAITLLGELSAEPAKARALSDRIHAQLDDVAHRVAGKPKVPAMLARDEDGYALIAGNTFADDLLRIAGGENVAHDFPLRYPNVDRERAVELSPRAIIQLMPDAPPQVVERARAMWQQTPEIPAVRDGRVYILSDWYALQPGSHIGDVAEKMADLLHR